MVRICAFPGCFNREKLVRLRHSGSKSQGESLTFHRFPRHDPQRLKLWLLALRLDPSTPTKIVRGLKVCSEHFSPDDLIENGSTGRRVLKSTAVPMLVPKTEEAVSKKDEDTEVLGAGMFFAGVPPSIPEKPETIRTSNGQNEESQSKLILIVSNPNQTRSSTSRTYYAFPPIQSSQSGEPAETEVKIESTDIDVNMHSVSPPSCMKDLSLIPPSSTSSQTAGQEDDKVVGQHWKERKWLVNESSLMKLFRFCQQCGAPVREPKKITSGSLILVQWECSMGHRGQWSSCFDVGGMAENDLHVAASILFSGATYVDIADWAALLNLQVPDKATFNGIQSSYLIPVIDSAYREQQTAMLQLLRMQNRPQKRVHLSGDGRSDSPGFSGKYNTYSFMDDTTNQIVHFELVQATEASSSGAMEPVGFKRGLNKLLEKGIDVEIVTTDRSPSIRKVMQVDYPDIHHEFDIRSVVKGFYKKLLSVSWKKGKQDLQPWIKSICNHLWYSCATCGGDANDLTKKWKSLLHHICGVHHWMEDGRQHRCHHDDLLPEQQRRRRWLRKESPAFQSLSSLVLNKGLLNDLRQMALFKHTGKLEVFHSRLLKYCQKNLHFHYSSMTARTKLAVLDYNENVHRGKTTTTKPSGQQHKALCTPHEPTTQNFRDDLFQKVLQRRMDPTVEFKDQSSQLALPQLPP
ncbi:uncharacterized protein LOC127422499 isoform X4 [Myxocyprinus asiaticus]|uniref:uncharacterized protein LOC127422499 isoform X4 n=1 Tax=Myxocyprinus asiaticus TaxID=70543 RepID=UPI00222255C2|nr:uncharacterized protein LOC127422499 isoform X4 [Myxocyprinus asiaticus]